MFEKQLKKILKLSCLFLGRPEVESPTPEEEEAATLNQEARDQIERERHKSPSPELYLEHLAGRDLTIGLGDSLVHHRLVPWETPDIIR